MPTSPRNQPPVQKSYDSSKVSQGRRKKDLPTSEHAPPRVHFGHTVKYQDKTLNSTKKDNCGKTNDQTRYEYTSDPESHMTSEKSITNISSRQNEPRSLRRYNSLNSKITTPGSVLLRKNSEDNLRSRKASMEFPTPGPRPSLDELSPLPVRKVSTGAVNAPRVSSFCSTRLSFQSVTKRVANLLRFRNAAVPRKTSVTESIAEENVISPNEIVEDLPKTPRFSTYMSPEAQYAMMKGYEDIIVEKLSNKYPEYNGQIKRNKTPHHSIIISDKGNFGHPKYRLSGKRNGVSVMEETADADMSKESKGIASDHSENSSPRPENEDGYKLDGSPVSKDTQAKFFRFPPVSQFEPRPAPTQGKRPSSDKSNSVAPSTVVVDSEINPENLTPLQNLRRLSLSFPHHSDRNNDDDVIENISKSNRAGATLPFNESIDRPSPLPHDRRIVLSYRFERAMDILDAMKPQYEHTLSPRVKESGRKVAPLVDFNRWADQWATEFKSDKIK